MLALGRGRRGASRWIALAIAAVAVLGTGQMAAPADAKPGKPVASEWEKLGRVPGANWYGAYIPSAGGAKLYADVLLPRKRSGRVPTILMAGPYFQHLRQTRGLPVQTPPDRYDDLVYGARLLERGYAVVFVDLRGYGGSSGCPDNSGAADRADLRQMVRWAATQRWSSGKVGMYGKSYDAVTGLMAAGGRIPGLSAVVAAEPVYDWYRYLYGNGVPRTTRVGTPLSLVYTSTNPPPQNVDSRQWREHTQRSAANLMNAACLPSAIVRAQNPEPNDPYWKSRPILPKLRGSRVPIFLSQGFIDQNTAADGLVEALQKLGGPVTGWLGMWDHVRGNDTDRTVMMGRATDRSSTGRTDYLDQVAAFYDHYLKGQGTAPTGFYVQDNTAAWRTQPSWPGSTSTRTVDLKTGTFRYDGKQVATKIRYKGRWVATQLDGVAAAAAANRASFDDPRNAVWTVLPPESTAIRISGKPKVTVTARVRNPEPAVAFVETPIAVDLYDVDPAGNAVMISQNVSVVERGETEVRLYATDWVVRAGHRLAIRVTDSNRYRWDYYDPSGRARVTITSGRAQLPLAPVNVGSPTTGTSNTSLEGYLRRYRYPVPVK
ncbi:MAG: CocE/NonD family hydrolase [Gordonia sp. (in: high G+C Gram-positive bacteria)]|uniref:CocE/NonD family hydrolase n=1 Tax=Gordonia sp. (in: high G+C Gram-positive bacteria) TaxID=84139 RepID=UPI0039E40B28